MHVGREGAISKEFRVDPIENVTFEQNLNMRANHAYFRGNTLYRGLRWKYAYQKESEQAMEARAEAERESRWQERMFMVDSSGVVEGGQIWDIIGR